jgi:protein-S-isoprenylcysteine O-methyltransferase Ste14
MINIFDKDKQLITSRDSRENEFSINIKSDSFQYMIIKIFPDNPKMLGAFSVISASGIRIIPHYKKALYTLLFIAVIALLYWLNKNFGFKKFHGNFKRKIEKQSQK